jgi:hypothetical protein
LVRIDGVFGSMVAKPSYCVPDVQNRSRKGRLSRKSVVDGGHGVTHVHKFDSMLAVCFLRASLPIAPMDINHQGPGCIVIGSLENIQADCPPIDFLERKVGGPLDSGGYFGSVVEYQRGISLRRSHEEFSVNAPRVIGRRLFQSVYCRGV